MKKIYITEKDWNAISLLVDLALQAVADAELDHKEHKKTSRRNSGYSADKRQWEKAEARVAKQIYSKGNV